MDCPISDYTAFPFENEFGHYKNDLKSGNKPLVQFCNNIERDLVFNNQKVTCTTDSEILRYEMTENIYQVQKLKFKNFEFTVEKPNNVILLKDESLVRIKDMVCSSIEENPDEVHIVGEKLQISDQPVHEYPTIAVELGIFKVTATNKCGSIQCTLNEMSSKVALFQIYAL
ncbi:hypothetical protein QAD02_013821 [Eretmocerus hayati]|uniref:Uncharacterized protein n=1 Tax=Eretmocerus hayati TaxID=131215 RepID=A0ACC2P653_9HYME|nr:hypothetical protein QAD02_013821 [Eretmocerus hayati]